MQDILQKIFKETQFVPSLNLSNLIWKRVQRRIMIIVSVRFSFYSLMVILSVVSFYKLLPDIYSEISSSWIGNIFSLVFSESMSSLVVIWKDVLYMFVESLPIMSFVVVWQELRLLMSKV